jgi:hypothetical protein
MRNGVSEAEIEGILRSPIAEFATAEGRVESHVIPFTRNDDYGTALRKLRSMVSQYLVPL